MTIQRLPAMALCAACVLLAACGSSSRIDVGSGSSSGGSSSGAVPADGVAGTPQPLDPGLANVNCPPNGKPADNATPPGQSHLHCAP